MITYRQRGLANAYAVFANVVAVALLPTYAALLPSLTYVELSSDVKLLPYGVAVFLGMAGSSRHIRRNHNRLHALSKWAALGIAFRQMLYVAAFIFAYMFAAKDRDVSRSCLIVYGPVKNKCSPVCAPCLLSHGRFGCRENLFFALGGAHAFALCVYDERFLGRA